MPDTNALPTVDVSFCEGLVENIFGGDKKVDKDGLVESLYSFFGLMEITDRLQYIMTKFVCNMADIEKDVLYGCGYTNNDINRFTDASIMEELENV